MNPLFVAKTTLSVKQTKIKLDMSFGACWCSNKARATIFVIIYKLCFVCWAGATADSRPPPQILD